MAKAVKKPRKKTNGYKMPDPVPPGEIFTDIGKKSWKIGSSIGKGGFGEIYLAQDASKSSSKYPFVIKVEPHGNGPLFVEMHFYMKNAKQSDVEAFKNKHKLETFGMPLYLGSGSHEIGSTKYRFIVMEKFSSDLDKLLVENKGALPVTTVFQLAWQIAYVLEYIHDLGYVHADIKGGNVLLGATPETKNQAYLVDFGLATKFSTDKDFKPNPKKAHDGTIEYLSRDAHQGVPTRRGDFEILGYNLVHWLGGTLPWDSIKDDPKTVQKLKEDSMSNIPKFIKLCFKKNLETIVKFMQYVNNLKFNEKPDYKKIRILFEQEVKKNGGDVNGPLEFTSNARKRRSTTNEKLDGIEIVNNISIGKVEKKRGKNFQETDYECYNGEVMNDAMKEVLAKKTDSNSSGVKKTGKNKQKKEENDKEVMTEAMKDVLARKREKELMKTKKPVIKKQEVEEDMECSTEEMIAIKKKINNRISPKQEQPTGIGRSRRNLPKLNYDERTPRREKR